MKNQNTLSVYLTSGNESGRLAAWCLLAVFVISTAIRIATLGVGSPFITIDDKTAFEGGFLGAGGGSDGLKYRIYKRR